MKSILVVDDEEVIRNMLLDHLEDLYKIYTAESGESALSLLQKKPVDLVITDINMPGIKGYELINIIRTRYPQTINILITAYNVDDYIRMAKKHNITNILSKTTPFNFTELKTLIQSLFDKKIFGIERHLSTGRNILKHYLVKKSSEAKLIREEIVKLFEDRYGTVKDLKLVLDEIMTNAIYHGPQTKEGKEKYKEFANVNLQPNEYVEITCASDEEKYGVSIIDNGGKLRKETILYKIDRHINAEGILDESGRGIHMSRLFSDRLIINIQKDQKTEIIVFNYIQDQYKGYKPLTINEI